MKSLLGSSRPLEGRTSRRSGKVLATAAAIAMLALPAPANAQFIRDAEIERLLSDYAAPILKAAGLGGQNIKVHIVRDASFNAFVVDGRNMFMNSGTIMKSATPNQVIGILAHETGHIAGGHLSGRRQAASRARSAALMAQILGLLGIAAGAVAGADSEIGSAASGVIFGGQSIAQRTLLSYVRAQESAADQAAVSYLNATRQSVRGMIETFEFFADQAIAGRRFADPYVLSHPMPRQRIAQLRNLAKRSRFFDKKDSPQLQLRHDLVRAKLWGFLERDPRLVLNRYPKSDQSLPGRYARAIARCRSAGPKACMPDLDALIKERPDYPYFWELKGEWLIRGGRPGDAIAPLRKAVALAPRESLTRIMFGQALLNSGKSGKSLDEAIKNLRKALARETEHALGYRMLATAYGRKKRYADAELASAHAYLYEGNVKLAKVQATRAKSKLRRGSAAWVQADDILNYQPPKGR